MIVVAATASATAFLANVEVNPDDAKAPGINALKDLVNGLAAYAVVAAVASVLLGGIAWALGERMGLDRASAVGKSGVLAGFGLAFLVGAAATFVNFFIATGSSADDATDNTNSMRPPAVVLTITPAPAEDIVDDPDVVHAPPSADF
ncbi:hypothetical protein CcI49_25060 [Frankia sp. CcI49]|uniref:DUF6112 family protein n=1 Tax=unclassified Frankia TaxID=2632575 RepID=UPI0006CA2EDF|nr:MULTISPECIES: DUF6112 family protein [unclassified Frankia]KPM52836.1 hypothetical protein ACG83_25685 [Frankia sp. R43]ONH57733.1 hypothetical protein CcI49_25060 [Frankia sp. CcI49]